jgi:hypothetical protein
MVSGKERKEVDRLQEEAVCHQEKYPEAATKRS